MLAVSGTARSRFAPDAAPYVEQGFTELSMREWYGLFMPGRTPAAVAQRANAAVRSPLATKELIDFGLPLGLEVVASPSPDDFARTFKADADLWGPCVRRPGFTADS